MERRKASLRAGTQKMGEQSSGVSSSESAVVKTIDDDSWDDLRMVWVTHTRS